ncbi:MAG: pentapeptide repeat-containing protein [Polyangiaceae bacterium]
MLINGRRPPERVPFVCAPSLAGTTFTTKLPPELVSTKLSPETTPQRVPRAADRAGLVDCLVAVIKLSLTLNSGNQRSAVPKQRADGLGGELFRESDLEGLLLYGGDFAPYKRLVDVTLSPPSKLKETKERTIEVGPLRRRIVDGYIQDFGPMSPFRAPRNELLGTFDDEWLRDRWPYFPKDFNVDYFNAAPVQQRMETLRGNEELTLVGFEEEHTRTRLPGITIRAFAQFARESGYRFEEIAVRLDTLHIDLASSTLQLVWRGQMPIASPLAPELTHIFACADRLLTPMPQRAAREQFARLVERNHLDEDELATASVGVPRSFGIPGLNKQARLTQQQRALKNQVEPSGGTPPLRPAVRPAMTREAVEEFVKSGSPLEEQDFTGCDLSDLDLSARSLKNSIFTAANLSRSVLRGAVLDGSVLSHAALTASDLRGSSLVECNLMCAELSRAELAGANLRDAQLERANLTGANLSSADLRRVNLTSSLLDGADLSQADLTQANLANAQASHAIFRKAILTDTLAYELYAPEANFDEASAERLRAGESDLRRTSWRRTEACGANLEGSNLEHACLELATFDDSSLAHCNLRGANLRRFRARSATFRHCRLAEADLRRADLMESNFEQADLRDADLSSSNLFEVETLDAELSGVRLKGADTTGSKLSHPLLGIKE